MIHTQKSTRRYSYNQYRIYCLNLLGRLITSTAENSSKASSPYTTPIGR